MSASPATLEQIKTILRRDLKLGPDVEIDDDKPFFGGDVDLDSLDMLLLVTSIEKQFKIKIPTEAVGRKVFETPTTLATYIDERMAGGDGGVTAPTATNTGGGEDPLARLPHGESFRFVSKIIQIKQNESGEAIWTVKGDEPFFAGHFPGNPIVPGVLLTEALAQFSGIVGHGGPGTKLAHIDIKFESAIKPPADIKLHCKFARQFGLNEQFDCTASVGETVAARGSITLVHTSWK